MIWTAESMLRQVELGEDSRLEFKQALFKTGRLRAPGREAVADELAAFGNSTGGTLVFSVSDSGEIQWLTRAQIDAIETFVGEICADSIRPPLHFTTQRLPLPDGLAVLVVEIEQSPLVHKSPGGYMVRLGSSKREMTPPVLQRLFQRRGRSGLLGPDEMPVVHTGRGTEETRELSGRDPEYELNDGTELRLTLPSAQPPMEGIVGEVLVMASGKPLAGVRVVVHYPNKTWMEATTDSFGRAGFGFYADLPITVYCAARGRTGHVEPGWRPPSPLSIQLENLPEGGSVIFTERTGHLPGLKGRLDPILDNRDRMYLYATNVAIEQGSQQPVQFKLYQPLRLTDVHGFEWSVRFIDMFGKSSLLEYRPPLAPPG